MTKNSRYYYKSALESAINNLFAVHKNLEACANYASDGTHNEHVQWLQDFDTQIFAMMTNLQEYERTI
jgi:hypothetical protein